MVNDKGLRLRYIFSVEQGKWVDRSETQEDKYDIIRKKFIATLGNDFFAEIDASFLVSLFASWIKADKECEQKARCDFLCAFNLALGRAIKRKQIKGIFS